MKNWITDYDWESFYFLRPDYSVFGGTIEFKNVPAYSDSFAVCVFMRNFDKRVWCAYAGHYDGNSWGETSTFTFSAEYIPTKDGMTNLVYEQDETSFGYFGGQSGGVDDEFGQKYDQKTNQWIIWAWNDGLNDRGKGSYDIYFYQSQVNSFEYYEFLNSFNATYYVP